MTHCLGQPDLRSRECEINRGENRGVMKYRMYGYAHASDAKNITLTSIANYRNEISEKTPVEAGTITMLAESFKNMPKPAPFQFTWKYEKGIPKTLFSGLKKGEDFSLDLRVQVIDDKSSVKVHVEFDFYQCRLIKMRTRGQVQTIEASFGGFQKRPE